MPHASFWLPEPEYTQDDVSRFMDKLADIAAGFGFITRGGPKAGRGNIRLLLEAIVNEKLVVVYPKTEEERDLEFMSQFLRRQKAVLLDAMVNGSREAVCPECLAPRNQGQCSAHADRDLLSIREAIDYIDERIQATEITLMKYTQRPLEVPSKQRETVGEGE